MSHNRFTDLVNNKGDWDLWFLSTRFWSYFVHTLALERVGVVIDNLKNFEQSNMPYHRLIVLHWISNYVNKVATSAISQYLV